jgi:hypothetical protein
VNELQIRALRIILAALTGDQFDADHVLEDVSGDPAFLAALAQELAAISATYLIIAVPQSAALQEVQGQIAYLLDARSRRGGRHHRHGRRRR